MAGRCPPAAARASLGAGRASPPCRLAAPVVRPADRRGLDPPPRRAAGLAAAAAAADPPLPPPDPLASELARLLITNPALAPPPTSPSPLLPPGEVARAVLAALQRPDWPTPGAGVQVAWDFTLPEETGGAAPMTAGAGRRGRSWDAAPTWLPRPAWEEAVVRSRPAALLVGAEAAGLSGPAQMTGRAGKNAIAPVLATAGGREFSFTLVLTRVDDPGPWAGCFLVSGLRVGDYSLVTGTPALARRMAASMLGVCFVV